RLGILVVDVAGEVRRREDGIGLVDERVDVDGERAHGGLGLLAEVAPLRRPQLVALGELDEETVDERAVLGAVGGAGVGGAGAGGTGWLAHGPRGPAGTRGAKAAGAAGVKREATPKRSRAPTRRAATSPSSGRVRSTRISSAAPARAGARPARASGSLA